MEQETILVIPVVLFLVLLFPVGIASGAVATAMVPGMSRQDIRSN